MTNQPVIERLAERITQRVMIARLRDAEGRGENESGYTNLRDRIAAELDEVGELVEAAQEVLDAPAPPRAVAAPMLAHQAAINKLRAALTRVQGKE